MTLSEGNISNRYYLTLSVTLTKLRDNRTEKGGDLLNKTLFCKKKNPATTEP